MYKAINGKLDKFLMEEYNNIAKAHFKSIETISTFFRYYLLIISIPISSIAYLFVNDKIQLVSDYYNIIVVSFFGIAIAGIIVMCYIINLRLDAVLYARVINSIRKYYFDSSEMQIDLKLKLRILPQSSYIPSYFEISYFLPVIVVLSLINTSYFLFALYILCKTTWGNTPGILLVVSSLVFMLFHIIIYMIYARYREYKYLKSNILGIDIDGVLNKHRENFCYMVNKELQKDISPDEIVIIPVNENPKIEITREEERKIFNNPEYWTKMPVINEAPEIIQKIQNSLNIKVYIFTYRPWPDHRDRKEIIKTVQIFLDNVGKSSLKILVLKVCKYLGTIGDSILVKYKEEPLKKITKEWLNRKKIHHHKFILEKGNDFSCDPRSKFKNRYNIARKKRIRFFVEDDIDKAKKLSHLCDIVFLFEQPYNSYNSLLPYKLNRGRLYLPSNILRVTSWNDIYQQLRKLS